MPLLQFAPLSSSPSPSFFHALTAHKLDVAKLDDDFIPIVGEFAEGKFIKDRGADGREVGLSGSVNVDGRCFDGERCVYLPFEGRSSSGGRH
jgi:ubiquitin-like modifier-activating enzyme ATG7